MRIQTHSFASPLAAAFLVIICGCATSTEQFGDTPRAQMSVSQARKALVESLHRTHYILVGDVSVRDVKIARDQATWVEITLPRGEPNYYGLVFADVSNMSVEDYGSNAVVSFHDKRGVLGTNSMLSSDKITAMNFVTAVLTLKAAAQRPGAYDDDFAAYAEQAKVWLATSPRPEMPDDARTYRLLAEDAFKRQDLMAALEAYENALEIFPMWPQGHYNAALLAAERNDFSSAADHMKRYLVLSPNAPDVRASKDKLLLWQHKAKQ